MCVGIGVYVHYFRFRFSSPSQLIALHQSRFRVNEQKTGMKKT